MSMQTHCPFIPHTFFSRFVTPSSMHCFIIVFALVANSLLGISLFPWACAIVLAIVGKRSLKFSFHLVAIVVAKPFSAM